MDIISKNEFDALCTHHRVLKSYDSGYPKLLSTEENTIIKVFFPKKKLLSSDKFKPRAKRFYDNCKAITQLGFHAPEVITVKHCPELRAHLLFYRKVAGRDVRKLVLNGEHHFLQLVLMLMANLHQHGIFFGAVHLENLLGTHDNQIALIDVVDLSIKNRPLNAIERYRNLRHLFLHDPVDRYLWQTAGFEQCIEHYLAATSLLPYQRQLITFLLKRKIKKAID